MHQCGLLGVREWARHHTQVEESEKSIVVDSLVRQTTSFSLDPWRAGT